MREQKLQTILLIFHNLYKIFDLMILSRNENGEMYEMLSILTKDK